MLPRPKTDPTEGVVTFVQHNPVPKDFVQRTAFLCVVHCKGIIRGENDVGSSEHADVLLPSLAMVPLDRESLAQVAISCQHAS